MSISHIDTGSSGVGATSFSVGYPGSPAAGDLFVLWVLNKYPASPPSTPSGFTLVDSHYAGAGASGTDSGEVLISCFVREATGSESGSETVTITGGNVSLGRMSLYRKTGGTWNYTVSKGSDVGLGTSFSATGATALSFAAGDMLTFGGGINGNVMALGSYGVSASGITFGTVGERGSAASSTGNDASMFSGDAEISSGSGTVAPTYTLALSGTPTANTPAGPLLFVRLSESAGATVPDITAVYADSITASSVTPRVTLDFA